MIIDLSKSNPYKHWEITATEKVRHTDGEDYCKISYKNSSLLRTAETIGELVLPLLIFKITLLATASFAAAILCGTAIALIPLHFDNILYYFSHVEVLSKRSLKDHLWKRISTCPSADKLYWQARTAHGGNIKLKLFPESSKFSKKLPEGSVACAQFGKDRIGMTLGKYNQNEDRILSKMVFELTNFSQVDRFYNVDANDADEFAEAFERIEYDGMKIHHQVIQEAIKTNQWNPATDIYGSYLKSRWTTFEGYWKDQKDHAHAEHYRNAWRKHHKHK